MWLRLTSECVIFLLSVYQEPKLSNTDDIILAELQSRLNDLELSKVHEDVSAALRKERSEILVSLRKIMEAMKSEAGGAGGVVVASSSKEMEKLRAENEELKKTNAKQRYRIEHLVHNLREKWQGGDV